jgi:hypothetical protein
LASREDDDLMPVADEAHREMAPDKARSARDQDFHALLWADPHPDPPPQGGRQTPKKYGD